MEQLPLVVLVVLLEGAEILLGEGPSRLADQVVGHQPGHAQAPVGADGLVERRQLQGDLGLAVGVGQRVGRAAGVRRPRRADRRAACPSLSRSSSRGPRRVGSPGRRPATGTPPGHRRGCCRRGRGHRRRPGSCRRRGPPRGGDRRGAGSGPHRRCWSTAGRPPGSARPGRSRGGGPGRDASRAPARRRAGRR